MYLILILHVLSSSSVGTTPFFQYQLFAVHLLQEIVIFKLNKGLLLSIICLQLTMCTFTFFVKFCYIGIILMVNMCVCIILLFVNKQTFWDSEFQIWALKGWSLARLTSAKNHILQSTYSK
jgi:hypothetical protein